MTGNIELAALIVAVGLCGAGLSIARALEIVAAAVGRHTRES